MAKIVTRLVKTPAERMATYRRRHRRQYHLFRIAIPATQIDALVRRGYLDPKKRDDKTAVGDAATAFISDLLDA